MLAATLLCVLLGLMAHLMKQARESQDRTEVLLAQLEHARSADTGRGDRRRTARELHDVLAHSMSSAAIQLQAVRMLAQPSRQARKYARRSTVPASWSRTVSLTLGKWSARCAASSCRVSRSSTRWLTASETK